MSVKTWVMLMAASMVALAIGLSVKVDFLIFFGVGGAIVSSFFKLVFMYRSRKQ